MRKPGTKTIAITKDEAELLIEGLMTKFAEQETTFTWNARVFRLIERIAETFGISPDTLDEKLGEENEIATTRRREPTSRTFTPLDQLNG